MSSAQTKNRRYVVSSNIAFREIEGQILVLLPDDTELYTFNTAAAFIWKGLMRRRGVARIADDLAGEFHIERTRAADDVARFVRDMEMKGLLKRAKSRR